MDKYIHTNDIFAPMHKQGFMKAKGEFPVSEELYKRGFSIPSGVNLKDKEIEEICQRII